LIVAASPRILDFLTDTPQRACACDVFRWLATALILSFCSIFLLKTVFDRH